MSFLDTIADLIWKRIKPEVDELQATAKQEMDEWQVIAQQQLDEWRADAMKTLAEALPRMAGEIAEKAVQTVFDNTQIDEATNDALGIVTGFFDQFRQGLKHLPFGVR